MRMPSSRSGGGARPEVVSVPACTPNTEKARVMLMVWAPTDCAVETAYSVLTRGTIGNVICVVRSRFGESCFQYAFTCAWLKGRVQGCGVNGSTSVLPPVSSVFQFEAGLLRCSRTHMFTILTIVLVVISKSKISTS